MCGKTFLETPRLIIKTMDDRDFCALRLQMKDPQVMEFFGGPREDSRIIATLELLNNHLLKYGFSQGPVFEKETGAFVGRAGLVHLDFKETPDLELGYFIMPEYWGKGFATEIGATLLDYAFNVLDCPRVFATVDPKNTASCRVSEKLEMTLEKEDIYETLHKRVRFYVKNKPIKEEK